MTLHGNLYLDVRGPSGLLEYTCKGTFAIKADKKSEPKQVSYSIYNFIYMIIHSLKSLEG